METKKTTPPAVQPPAETPKKPTKPKNLWQKARSIKHFELLVAGALIAILILIYVTVSSATGQTSVAPGNEQTLANQLETTLSQIAGVGRVQVLITYSGGPTTEIVMRTERQHTPNGIVEIVTPVLVTVGGQQQPIVLREIAAQIEGIVVVAQGGADFRVQFDIIRALQTALGVSAHQIQVFSMR